ncbi:hypothetical protein F2Q70_00033130 [Brassica cretica]|uniref:Uncharacterized protein n=1 Tax=Brassica cretica TaxID=69181 RepID=A0A8S9FRC8_BRACR|nr:hypothetical protein F2Q70_00033130 [Brassica cretica]
MLRKFLVDSPYMWWPLNLVQVSLFRALHEKEEKREGQQTRLRFFLIVFFLSFAYYIIPGYIFPSISSLSFLCWIWIRSVTAQQIGSGLQGLGIGSFGLDCNAYDAKKFSLFTSTTFDHTGQKFNTTRILNQKTFDINLAAYESYSKLYLSVVFALIYGLSFGTLTATVSHVALFDGKKFLVDSPYMWWPSNLVQVSLFRALHEKEEKREGQQTRLRFFLIVFFLSFAYYIIPGYIFPSISSLSFLCWIWIRSVTAQQIGSGLQGLGIGSFGLDWSVVAGFLGSPLAVPFFAIANFFA